MSELPPKTFWTANFVARQFRRKRGGDDDDIKAVWRIKDKLGMDRAEKRTLERLKQKDFPLGYAQYPEEKQAEAGAQNPEKNKAESNVQKREDDKADLIIVDHLKQGFSDHKDLWPQSLLEPKNDAWLLVRWVHPQLDKNTQFWKDVQRGFGGRIVVVFAAEHLRLYGMQISRGLSWEKTVHELHERVSWMWQKSLYGCAHLVVSFFPAGAVVFSDMSDWKAGSADLFRSANLRVQLIYDPAQIEATWAERFEGDMMGSTRCLTAGIALEMMLADSKPNGSEYAPDYARGAMAGLLAGRHAFIEGFATKGSQQRHDTALPETMEFPVTTVAQVLARVCDKEASDGSVSDERRILHKWIDRQEAAIVRRSFTSKEIAPAWRLLDGSLQVAAGGPIEYAGDIVRYGATHRSKLFDFPTLRIGKLFITDRTEMETIRDVRGLLVNYMSPETVSAPLSIAVFGQPGSGKSFAIKELARDLSDDHQSRVPRMPLEEVTFNVAQFSGLPSLATALHRVRDIGLSGKIPLVFWDEFDSNFEQHALGWLRFFLAPMQDGQFLDGSNLHNVGRAIFVFAGGTFSTMAGFQTGSSDDPAGECEVHGGRLDYAAIKRAKLPDFISRLKGFVDVPTLNYRAGEVDTSILLRRAELLRSFLKQTAPKLIQFVQRAKEHELFEFLNVDQGVLEAFLLIPKYVYGARSMEAIVKMSALSDKFLFDRASLPPLDQLKLHVDAAVFAAIADRKWGPPPAPGQTGPRRR